MKASGIPAPEFGHHVKDRPLYRAWIIAQGTALRFFDPDAGWYMRASMYWALYERNAREPWADEVAWHAAKTMPGRDECYASCMVELIAGGPQKYWTLLPQGDSVSAAIDLATKLGRYALSASAEEPATRAQLSAMRASLARVGSPKKAEFLELIEGLEAAIPRQRQFHQNHSLGASGFTAMRASDYVRVAASARSRR